MPQSADNNRMAKRAQRTRVLWILLAGLLLIAVLAPIGWWLEKSGDARLVLAKAKASGLAANNVALEFYGTNQTFADASSAFGLTPKAETAIRELSQCEGDFYLLQWDAKNYSIQKSAYAENGYVAVYSKSEETGGRWELYRMDSMMLG